jgi:predicted homoserine dehydrogenase-like protein
LYRRLKEFAKQNRPIRVALIGAGSMGKGIAHQLSVVPGMQLVAVCDKDIQAAEIATAAYGRPAKRVDRSAAVSDAQVLVSDDPHFSQCGLHDVDYDVLVEATNSIGFAGQVCAAAIQAGRHVVLMNAEVDLALGGWLHQLAQRHGVVVTSDAGDQHGVLVKLMDEIQLWGFRPVMAGNIKGFLDRYATAESLQHEAAVRRLNPIQCCAYTDGTKLSIEMALVANATGMVPTRPGMEGARAEHVSEVLQLFDFEKYPDSGVVDYILGAEPGGGVFVVGHCEDTFQVPYLAYYKLGDGPFYVFYRPYHLCHLETPGAIAHAVLDGREILRADAARVAEVFAFAKRDLQAGEPIETAIGGGSCYGMIDTIGHADDRVPITLLETQHDLEDVPRIKAAIARDQPLRWSEIEMPESQLMRLVTSHR